ncbi:MAG: lytic transglycosylase domain-containing protein [Tannerella sp.]|jgi:hypothetical protein|nr:lytic transglycosylase domain-containing protein [Tannerella sp.]
MKNYLIILIIASACTITGYRDSTVVERERPEISPYAVSPEIPPTITFFGKEYDFRRYNMREGIDRELTSMTYQHSMTMLAFKRANRWFPVIEPILKSHGIPDDFKYLATIESTLDPKIVSPAKAVGMWQLLESTGRSYGLTITATVDERRNVVRSTEAACKYLREAYTKYGDWLTVAVSYNSGMGRMNEQKALQGEESVFDMYFVEETTRYPYRMFAAKLIFENPLKYGFKFKAADLYAPLDCDEVTVDSDIADLPGFAHHHGITYFDLKFCNMWLKDSKLITGGKKFTVLIPKKNSLYYNKPNSYVHNPDWVINQQSW